MYQAVVAFDDASTASARTAAVTAVDTAQQFGLTAYHGVAPAYAIRARTTGDPEAASSDALHALDLVRRASTDLALGYVLTLCGDILTDLGDPVGRSLLAEARSILATCPDPGGARTPGPTEQLTDRETAVLRYLPANLSQRDIAAELYVSLNTVKTHCHAIYRKLGVSDRKAAVQTARDLHIL